MGTLPPEARRYPGSRALSATIARGHAADVLGTSSDRRARRVVVSALIERGVLTSESSRAPLHIAFPATLASRWMPGLFPEQA
jgi:hypothetical protein